MNDLIFNWEDANLQKIASFAETHNIYIVLQDKRDKTFSQIKFMYVLLKEIAKDYDSAVIECNYCENRIKELIDIYKEKGEYTHLTNSEYSHLSVQQALDFVINNNIKKLCQRI